MLSLALLLSVWSLLLLRGGDSLPLRDTHSPVVLDITIDGLPSRLLPNVSLGLNQVAEREGRQCTNDGRVKGPRSADILFEGSKQGHRLTYTPNRRTQSSTVRDALHQRVQTAVVLAVGGHSHSHYNYGPGGSINGLLAVWDSWLEHFFSLSANTTSLVLLFDERDFLRQNTTRSRKEYLDTIVVKNMGAEAVDCVHLRMRNDPLHQRRPHNTHSSHNARHGSAHHTTRADNANNNNIPRRLDNNINTNTNNNNGNANNLNTNANPAHHRGAPLQTAWGPTVTGLEPSYRLGCSNELRLDAGYRVYFVDPATLPAMYNNNNSYSRNKPFLIFAAVHPFPKPEWAEKEDEDELFKNWKPFRLNRRYPTNYGYVKMTNWYAYHMMNLKLLDFFDYAAKLDNDVSFVAPFPNLNVPLTMAQGEHVMLVTQKQWYHDDPRISQGVQHCLYSYVAQEAKHCQAIYEQLQPTGNAERTVYKGIELVPGGFADSTFFETNFNTTFRAHFLVFWLGLYTAPETMHMAKHWNDWHPRGMWDFRWGDQQWWPRPIAFFGEGNLKKEILHYDEIDTDNERFVVHKQWPRWGTIPKANYYNVNGSTKKDRDELYRVVSKPFIY